MKPTIGHVVILTISEEQAKKINEHRAVNSRVLGGNVAQAGEQYPLIVTAVWSESCLNGQAMLDGNDTLWITSAQQGDAHGQWRWPTRE